KVILSYIYYALITNAEIGRYPGTPLQQFTYYLTGYGGERTFGAWLWIGLAVVVWRAARTYRIERHTFVRLCASYAVPLAMYLIIAVTKVKLWAFGSVFCATFSFLVLRDLVWLWKQKSFTVANVQMPYVLPVLLAVLLVKTVL